MLLNIKSGKSRVGNRAMKLTYVKLSFLESKSDLLLSIESGLQFSLTFMRKGIIPQEEQLYPAVNVTCRCHMFKSYALLW